MRRRSHVYFVRAFIGPAKKAGITQEEASERSGIHYRSYRRYESGEREPSASSLSALADLFGVSTDYLLGRQETP